MKSFQKSLLIGAMLVGFGASAGAATADKTGADKAGMDRMSMHGQDGEKFHERMMERRAKHLAEVHDKLKLSASQETAWKAYVQATAPAASDKHADRAEFAKLSAPERMERMLNHMKDQEARMATHLAALKTFYATLTPEQKTVFNDSTKMMHGHRGERGHG